MANRFRWMIVGFPAMCFALSACSEADSGESSQPRPSVGTNGSSAGTTRGNNGISTAIGPVLGSTVTINVKPDGGMSAVDTGGTGAAGSLPTGDDNCGKVTMDTARLPADILIVLDRSSSMAGGADSGNSFCLPIGRTCPSRWSAVTSAVKTTLNSTSGSINWGLKFFTSPGANECGVNPGAEVPIAAGSVATIEAMMAQTMPGSNTPTEQAIRSATEYLRTVQDPNSKYILLATDGEPNCRPGAGNLSSNVVGTRDAIAAAFAAGFPVYVIGIGPSVGNLDEFATAGGTGKSFPASSPQALTDAFSSISKAVATCTFTATKPAPDPNNIAVYLDAALVAKDATHGWSFGANTQTIVLNGAACAKVMDGAASNVRVLFGCPGVTPPPIL